MGGERERLRRRLEALTVASRNFEDRARGAAERADDLARCAEQVEAWRERPEAVDDPPARLRTLPDPPTARMLAAAFQQADDPWAEVARRARAMADAAAREAEAQREQAERTERMRAEAEARLGDPDAGLGG